MHEHIRSLAQPVADQNGLLNFTTLNISITEKIYNREKQRLLEGT